MGGSIFFGGYDRAKIQGKNVTFPISRETSCRTGLVARVISVDVKFEHGTTQNIHASLIRMCLDPTFAIVSLPDSIVEKFESKAGGHYKGLSLGRAMNRMLYDVSDVLAVPWILYLWATTFG